jgi:CIC family chloride channel protein
MASDGADESRSRSADANGPLRHVTEPLAWLRRIFLPKAAEDIPLLPSAEHTVLIALAALVGLYAGLAATFLRATVELASVVIAHPDSLLALLTDAGSPQRAAFLSALPKEGRFREVLSFAGIGLVVFGSVGLARELMRRRAMPAWQRLPRLLLIALSLGLAGLLYVGVTFLVASAHALEELAGGLTATFNDASWIGLIAIALIGGLLTGVVALRFKGARSHGVSEIIEGVAIRGGALEPARGLSYAGASVLTAASMGSVGLEGPVVFFGASTASGLGGWLRLSRSRLRVLAAAGAAAGIAASFNAPIAGALFALEIIIGDFALASFSPVVIASVTGAVVSRSIAGDTHVLTGIRFHLESGYEIFLYVLLGIVTGVVGSILVKSIEGMKDTLSRRLDLVPTWLRPAVAFVGLVVIAKLLGRSEFLGSGHAAISTVLASSTTWTVLLLVIVGKMMATSITLGAGGVGGVMFPSLLVGGATGALFGQIVGFMFGDRVSDPASYAVVGMGALLTAVQHAPLTATVMVFEFTNDYTVMLPLLVACILSTLLSTRALGGSIYERALRQRGVVISRGKAVNVMRTISVRDTMRGDVPLVRATVRVKDLPVLLAGSHASTFAIVDADDALVGALSIVDVQHALVDPVRAENLTAMDIGTPGVATVCPDDDLAVAVEKLALQPFEHLIVVEKRDATKVVGLLSAQDILSRYQDALKRAGLAGLEGEPLTGESELTGPPETVPR